MDLRDYLIGFDDGEGEGEVETIFLNGEWYSRETWDSILKEFTNDYDKLHAVAQKYQLGPGGVSVVDTILAELERQRAAVLANISTTG